MSNEITKSECCAAPAVAKPEREVFIRPQYTVKETEGAYEVGVVMPGVAKSDVRVSMEDGQLTIIGDRHCAVPEGWKPVARELVAGSYRLNLEVRVEIDEERISAKLEDGVLTLRLPLSEAAKPRTIEVG